MELTDPKAMRALAHPMRLAILECLREHPATATQIADRLGTTPGTASYHLRALARWSFIEEVGGGVGRERRWAAKHLGVRVAAGSESNPAFQAASSALRGAILQRDAEALADFLQREAGENELWRDDAVFSSFTLSLERPELQKLIGEILKLLAPYQVERREGRRDPDAREVRLVLRAIPAPPD